MIKYQVLNSQTVLIFKVLNTEILLKFHEDFHATYDMDFYDVMFFFNRYNILVFGNAFSLNLFRYM